MRAVIYAEDFEPITVVELPQFAVDYLEMHNWVRLAVPSKVITVPLANPDSFDCHMPIVTIRAERLRLHRRTHHLMLFTKDEESALLLKSAFLPGQQHALNEAERHAFAQGFLHALSKLGL